jgi:hypothetical protein
MLACCGMDSRPDGFNPPRNQARAERHDKKRGWTATTQPPLIHSIGRRRERSDLTSRDAVVASLDAAKIR